MKGMTTIHSGEGYILYPRYRPKDSASMKTETKKIFDIPETRFRNSLPHNIQKYYASKLALPVILPIDDYNLNMNGVDIHNQLREDLSI